MIFNEMRFIDIGNKHSDDDIEVIFDNHKKYITSPFQRAYVWDEYQVTGLLNAINDLVTMKSTDDYSFGTPVLRRTKSNNMYEIVDGQQRITTMMLFLLALYHHGKEVGQSIEDEDEKEDLEDYLHYIINPVLDAKMTNHRSYIATTQRNSSGDIVITPIIEYNDNITNSKLSLLFKENLTEDDYKDINKKVSKSKIKDSGYFLHKNFLFIMKFLKENDYDSVKIKKSLKHIDERIKGGIQVHDSNENAQKSFSNLNKYGRRLTETELIKSGLYGVLENKGLHQVKNTMIEYWTNNYEHGFWVENTKKKNTNLENYMQNITISYMNKSMTSAIDCIRNSGVGLSDFFVEMFENQGSDHKIKHLWETITTTDEETYLAINQNVTDDKNSWQWITNYAAKVLNNQHAVRPVFMLMRRNCISTEDYIKSLWTVTACCLSLMHRRIDMHSSNLMQTIGTSIDSPIYKKDFTHDEIVDFLTSLYESKNKWESSDNLASFIKNNNYKNNSRTNKLITESLIFVYNYKNYLEGTPDNMVNTFSLQLENSREHIIPQRPEDYVIMNDEEKMTHNYMVGKIANALVINKANNSSLSNKTLAEKYVIYKELAQKENSAAAYWINKWLNYIQENGIDAETVEEFWDKNASDEYSEILAQEISKVLSPENPNKINYDSSFIKLYEDYNMKPYDKIYVREKHMKDMYIELTITPEIYLSHNGEIYKTMKTLLHGNYQKSGIDKVFYVIQTIDNKDHYIPLKELKKD